MDVPEFGNRDLKEKKNYLVTNSEQGLAMDTHESRRKIKEKQLLCRFK